MQTLFNTLTKPISERKKFDIVYRNMRADYKGHVISKDIDNLADLKHFGRRLDATYWYKFQTPANDSNPRGKAAQVNEVYTGTKPKSNRKIEYEPQKTRHYFNSNLQTRSSDEKVKKSGNNNILKSNQSGWETLLNNYQPPKEGYCFNCRLKGHHARDCERPKHKYCTRCGFHNVETTTCPFCGKNAIKTVPEGRQVEHYFDTSYEMNEIIIHPENGQRPFVEVSVYGNSLVGLLDSGAHLSILGIGALKLLEKCDLRLFPSEVSLKTANGQELEVKGTVYLPVTFNEETKVIETLVVPSLKRKILLGINFWNSFHITPTIQKARIESIEVHEDVEPADRLAMEHEETLLNDVQKLHLEKVKKKFKIAGEDTLDTTDWVSHRIELTEEAKKLSPARINPFPTSPSRQQQINAELDRMLKSNIIEKSYSDWALRLVPVDKSDGRGLYQFTRMPFGLVNSPATLSRLMDRVLGGGELEPKVFVYLDDIIIVSDTFEEHLALLEEVAARLRAANLSINISKSRFCVTEVPYLGYILGRGGLRPNPDRVSAIVNYERPESLRALRRFLGMCNYYRRFLANYSEVTQPLTDLLRNKPKRVHWNEQAEASFISVKNHLISAPILTNPNFALPFAIHCDASSKIYREI
ncbi:uncharacterized protein LOC129728436 [Wyeomyia smithii]|uniref:uncharacterized protein LOC129728436 n=1 Tax=Wyeomyia smithii TaxID=174621 RepID=UPI00246809D0|nr:uncharacterized protein LOC129728436 [Wyeomyia smithii]